MILLVFVYSFMCGHIWVIKLGASCLVYMCLQLLSLPVELFPLVSSDLLASSNKLFVFLVSRGGSLSYIFESSSFPIWAFTTINFPSGSAFNCLPISLWKFNWKLETTYIEAYCQKVSASSCHCIFLLLLTCSFSPFCLTTCLLPVFFLSNYFALLFCCFCDILENVLGCWFCTHQLFNVFLTINFSLFL